MGRLAKLLSFVRVTRNDVNASDVKIDPGGGPNITAEHFSSAGDDSHPLQGDFVVTNDVQRSGGEVIVGYLDPLNEQKANPGDKRIYARDSNTGAMIVELWLKNDGTAIMSNANGSAMLRSDGGIITTTPGSTFDAAADGSIKGDNGFGSFELTAGGDFLVNGVTIDINGNITSPASISAPSVVVNSKELAEHTHAITSGSSAPGPTGPNN